jgi:hypothetical protein
VDNLIIMCNVSQGDLNKRLSAKTVFNAFMRLVANASAPLLQSQALANAHMADRETRWAAKSTLGTLAFVLKAALENVDPCI